MRCSVNPFSNISDKKQRLEAELKYFKMLADARYHEYRFLFWDAVSKVIWQNRVLKWRIKHLEERK